MCLKNNSKEKKIISEVFLLKVSTLQGDKNAYNEFKW